MSEPAERRINKTRWPDGPWMHEPDRVDFEHAGLPCLLLRNGKGAWCGYAAVPPGHPWHGVDYKACLAPGAPGHDPEDEDSAWHDCQETLQERVRVHGGLTYSAACEGPICHVPKPGEPDAVWWFGFDCMHLGRDFAPRYALEMPGIYGLFGEAIYRDLAYARAQTERLAEQLAAVRP